MSRAQHGVPGQLPCWLAPPASGSCSSDPFDAVMGQRRGLSPEQSAGFRPALFDRGERCSFCELLAYGRDAVQAAPGGRLACSVCFADYFLRCADCGYLADRHELALYERELNAACGWELNLDDLLCREHVYAAYLDAWLEDHPSVSRELARLAPGG